jgi:hypothetical protein
MWVKRLLIANTAVFLAMAVGVLPARWVVPLFGFSVQDFLIHPWSPITYMFLHGGFWHLFVNMLAVFFFGPPLERKWGGKYFIKFYLIAGIGGALFSLILYPLIGPSLMIGASGAVFGLLMAFAMNWPDAPIYIWGVLPIKAKYFVSRCSPSRLEAVATWPTGPTWAAWSRASCTSGSETGSLAAQSACCSRTRAPGSRWSKAMRLRTPARASVRGADRGRTATRWTVWTASWTRSARRESMRSPTKSANSWTR